MHCAYTLTSRDTAERPVVCLLCQRLSQWVVEVISRVYVCKNTQMPSGVRAHSTRGVDASWALFKGVSMEYFVVSWSSPHMFIKFYCMDVTAYNVSRITDTATSDLLSLTA